MLESSFGSSFPVEDGSAVIHLRSPETVVSRAVTNDMLTSDVFAVVVQRGVERICRGDMGDIPRWHPGASADGLFRSDFSMSSEERTNSTLMSFNCLFSGVGSGVRHTIDPTSYLEKLTNSIASDHYSIGLS